MTKGGQLRVNAFNAIGEVICLTPKIAMVNVHADQLKTRYLGHDTKVLNIEKEAIMDFEEKLRIEIEQKYPNVGDYSKHPINKILGKIGCTIY